MKPRTLISTLALSALAIGGTACGSSSSSTSKADQTTTSSAAATTTAPVADGITVTGAWARMSPSGVTLGAAYMTLTSANDHSDSTMEPATSMPMNGQMVMRQVEAIDLPGGKAVELKPGGYHIMLIDLAKPLTVGKTIKMTLDFEKHGDLMVDVPVKEG